MKFLAEFTTIVGVFVVLRAKRPPNNWWKTTAMGMGILMRVTVMSIANVLLLPIFVSGQTFAAVIALLPLLSIFNALQGAISIFGGFLLYEAIALRLHNEKNP